MIYNNRLIDEKINDYKKVSILLNLKRYLFYFFVAFLLSRINILFYIAPIGITFSIICVLKNDKIFGIIVCLFSMLGYFTTKSNFITFDLYIIINLLLIFLNFLDLKNNLKKILILNLVGILIFLYKYFIIGFSIYSSLFSVVTEISIILALYFVFNNLLEL